jgi:NADPH:quinone reductase-like Zn-dependent oxidoreductase
MRAVGLRPHDLLMRVEANGVNPDDTKLQGGKIVLQGWS